MRVASAESDQPGPRAVLRCPGCGATVRVTVRGGAALRVDLVHEDLCTWLRAAGRGLPMAPLELRVLEEGCP